MHISSDWKQLNLLHTKATNLPICPHKQTDIVYSLEWRYNMRKPGSVLHSSPLQPKASIQVLLCFTMATFGGRQYGEELSITNLLIVSVHINFFFIPIDNIGETCFHNLCVGEVVSFAWTSCSWPEPNTVKQWLMLFFLNLLHSLKARALHWSKFSPWEIQQITISYKFFIEF